MKRILSFVLVLCMVLGMSVSAFADGATLEALLTADVLNANEATITLNENVTWTTGAGHGSTPIVPDTAAVQNLTIDGNGNTITAIGQGVGSLRAANGGTITFKNMTIVDESVSYNENAWELTYLEFAGNLVFENVDFVGGISLDTDNGQASGVNATFTNCTFTTNEDSVYGVWVGHGDVSFDNCTFTGTRGLKVHEAYGSEVTEVTVDNCTFNGLTKKPGLALGDLNADTTVTISNCEFINCQAGDNGNYMYETDTDVTAFDFNLDDKNEVATPDNGSIVRAYLSEQKGRIMVDMENVAYDNSVELKLYSGNECLATATLNIEEYPGTAAFGELTGSITINEKDPSDTWPVDEWTPLDSKVPTKVVLVVDGTVVDTMETIYNGLDGAVMTEKDWVDFEGTLAVVEPDDDDEEVEEEEVEEEEPTYPVKIEKTENGSVKVSEDEPVKGERVTITPKAKKGYVVESVVVTDKKGNELKVTDNGDGTYSFRQSDKRVTVTVNFVAEGAVSTPSTDKANPSTGANDFVGAAVALAVVSAMGVAVLNKRK